MRYFKTVNGFLWSFFQSDFLWKITSCCFFLKRSRNQPAATVSHWRKKCGLRCHDVRESERASRRAGRQRSSWGHSHDPRPLGYVITKETPCRQFSVLVITKLIVGKRVRKFSLLHIHMLWKDSMTCKKSHPPPSFILFYACMLCTRLFLNRALGIFEMNQP